MLQPQQIEELIRIVSALDREAIVREVVNCPARFPVDFTREFLNTIPLERLRHIFLALCIQCQHLPEVEHADSV